MLRRFNFLSLILLASILMGPGKALSTPWVPQSASGDPMDPALSGSADPEIDRSPVWAMVYGRYLYLLGREMFWPDIDRQDRFRIAVVNWPDLAEDLGNRLDGRAIAGLPVDVIALGEDELATHREDFTMVFLGGSNDPSSEESLGEALSKWMRKAERTALVMTDGASIQGHDLAFRRRKEGEGLTLCIAPDLTSMTAKSLDLPPHFLQRTCP